MNQAHIHLMITHLPIFGTFLGILVLIYGIFVKSNHTIIAAYYLFIISALGAATAYLTGEGAEEHVEHLQGIVESTIKRHEDFATIALISLITLSVISLVGLYLTFIKSRLAGTAALIILAVSLISFGLVARTGYLGGQIRHSEINSVTIDNTLPDLKTDKDD